MTTISVAQSKLEAAERAEEKTESQTAKMKQYFEKSEIYQQFVQEKSSEGKDKTQCEANEKEFEDLEAKYTNL
jgi:hypothetical protein